MKQHPALHKDRDTEHCTGSPWKSSAKATKSKLHTTPQNRERHTTPILLLKHLISNENMIHCTLFKLGSTNFSKHDISKQKSLRIQMFKEEKAQSKLPITAPTLCLHRRVSTTTFRLSCALVLLSTCSQNCCKEPRSKKLCKAALKIGFLSLKIQVFQAQAPHWESRSYQSIKYQTQTRLLNP